jgi:N-acetylglucosaminyldiphosphoundecaprenol N-acetyl-beta-D-mannosaminyltransferase
MHVVAEALHDREYKGNLDAADLCVADGTPLMWMGRIVGFPIARRVYGPDLMVEVLRRTAGTGTRHFFYGGREGVAEELARRMCLRFPGLEVCGTHSPPFERVLPKREDPAVLERIRGARPDVLWVGLGAPKQEHWMASRRGALAVPVLVGVGAAFDFLTGQTPQAPVWMRNYGLEWFFRLASEPKRLWRRYLVGGSEFAIRLLIQLSTGRIRQRTLSVRRAAGS